MELGTFGAILNFAITLEKKAVDFYTEAARKTSEKIFEELTKDSQKRLDRLERTRREGVSEMILEPITGLEDNSYQVELNTDVEKSALIQQAQAFEASTARFYKDAASKLPIREVARVFERLGRESEQRKDILISAEY